MVSPVFAIFLGALFSGAPAHAAPMAQLSSPAAAQKVLADADGDDGDGDDMIQIGAGAYLDDESMAALLRVSSSGFGEGETHYFVVSSQVVVGRGESSSGLLELELSVVPVSFEEEEGIERQLRVLPVRIGREVELGVSRSAEIEVVGASIELGNEEPQLKHLTRFAELAVDAVGLNYTGFTSGDSFRGVQLGHAEIEGGIGYRIAPERAVRLVAELESGVSRGDWTSQASAQRAWDASSEASLTAEYLFQAFGHEFAAFAESAYERHDLMSASNSARRGEFNIRLGLSSAL